MGRVEPRLELDQESVDFGQVPLGATKLSTLLIRNTGTAVLTIDMIGAGAPFALSEVAYDIGSGEEVALELSFAPEMVGSVTSTLTISSNDPESPSLIIPLTGEGVEGTLVVFPNEVDLGNTKVGDVQSAEVVLQNVSVADTSGRLVLLGFERAEHFDFPLSATFEQPGPFTVAAGQSEVIELVYRPLESGQDPGRMMFEVCGDRCGLLVTVVASAVRSNVILEPPRLDFGEVPLGQSVSLPLSVLNAGEDPATIVELSASGSGELRVVANAQLPATLAPGQSLSASVELQAVSAGEYEGEVRVDVGTTNERLRAFVVATAVGPRFEVAPEIINFGIVREGGTGRRQALLINAGSAQVEVTNVELQGAPEFSMEALPPPPLSIGPGESLVVAVNFQPGAIGEYNATLIVDSNDPVEPRLEVPVIGAMADRICEIDATPARLGFGYVPMGFGRSQDVVVSNVGTDPCTIIAGDFRAPLEPSFVASNAGWPQMLAPGQSLALSFDYAPQSNTQHKANYVLTTDDPVFPEHPVNLNGTSQGYSDILVLPEFIDMGTTAVGCAPRRGAFTIYNTGTEEIQFGATVLTATTGALSMVSVSGPFAMSPGSARTETIEYDPMSTGRDYGYATVNPLDRPHPINVPVFGQAAATPTALDVFQQRRNDKVDVLFVVDNSCSMSDDQMNLASNFQAFIQQADLRSINFQIGVTTTDVFRNPGVLVGPVLTPSTFQLESAFAAQVSVGINGSGREQGLEAASQALARAREGVAPNRDLIRQGAAFVGIYVSDEEDQSPFGVAAYFQEMARLFGSDFVTAAVAGDPSCPRASLGQRYRDMAQLSGGVLEPICSNWASSLANVGQAAFGLRSVFVLSQNAVGATGMTVLVNGAVVTNWTYDSVSGAVVFMTPPPEGANIEVSYVPRC